MSLPDPGKAHEIYREGTSGGKSILSAEDFNSFKNYEIYLWLGLMGLVLSCIVGYCELFMDRKIVKNTKWKGDNENVGKHSAENPEGRIEEPEEPKLEPILNGKV